MFENVGEKIKGVAVVVFILEVIAAVVFGLGSIDNGGILLIALGILAAWVSSLFVYGFGVLIESAEENKKISKQILEALTGEKEKSVAEETLAQKRCPHCGVMIDFDYPKCPNCDHDVNI